MKKIVISGYYGFNNFGDEISLQVIVKTLQDQGIDVTVLSSNPEMTVLTHGVISLYTFSIFDIIRQIFVSDALISGGSAMIMVIFQALFSGRGMGWFMHHMVALAGATFFVSVFQAVCKIECNQELIIAGTAMPLLPGVAITNAIRDTLQGDYISGAARVMEAFVKAVSCAVGIGIGLYLGSLVTGGVL